MRERRPRHHLAEFPPTARRPRRAVPAAEAAAFTHVAQQALADFEVGEQLTDRVVEVDRVPLLDLRPAQVVEIVAEDGLNAPVCLAINSIARLKWGIVLCDMLATQASMTRSLRAFLGSLSGARNGGVDLRLHVRGRESPLRIAMVFEAATTKSPRAGCTPRSNAAATADMSDPASVRTSGRTPAGSARGKRA